MPRLTDKDNIRALLSDDPVWSVYALGDLEQGTFAKTRWFTPDVTLVLHDYGTSILFAIGTRSVREALDHVTWPVHLQVREDALAEVARHATITTTRLMWRMGWSGAAPRSRRGGKPRCAQHAARRLGIDDGPALQQLYADGETAGESPEFFFPSMVTNGVYFGVYEGRALVAVAGTHLLSRVEGAAAIGNVYTRRDRRGRGLGRVVTSAVLDALAGVETIGLSVRADNAAALHVYESLGFVRHCQFHEAMATDWRNRRACSPGLPPAPEEGKFGHRPIPAGRAARLTQP
jgi:ribosomal protein S18 acetylase RimI-like enzyme